MKFRLLFRKYIYSRCVGQQIVKKCGNTENMHNCTELKCLDCSRAVCAYICNQYEKGDDDKRLYPVDPKRRGRVDQILYESGKTDNQIRAYAVSVFRTYKTVTSQADVQIKS